MGRNNINFNLLSLNARGLRTFDRRKAFFNWLAKSSADICFLQETYSTSEVENIWKKQWKGDMFFSHGTGHSKGVLILVRDHLDFKLQSVKVDSQGRYILLEATIQDSPFLLLNIYAPNKCSEQCDFFKTISEVLKSSFTISDYSVIVGGDFNVIFDQELDGSGGLKKTKDSVKVLEDICLEHDLLDIWRVRHPKEKRFAWRQKTPIIQRRLDFWLISDVLQDDVVSVDIKPSIKSDHSAITLLINGVDDSERGPSFWKFNSTLVNDSDYRFLLDENIKNWLEEFKEVVDKRVLWLTIKYSKEKAHSRKAKIKDLEEKLLNCTKNCENDPSKENIEELECLQAQYDDLYDYITQGAIIRSRANWYEKGEKNNKYFLNLEKSNKKKSCVRSIVTGDGTITVNPKTILNELESFYSNLYSEENSGHSSSFLDDVKEFPTLTEEIRNSCEGKIEYNECFKVLQSFQKNKTPGNDGLTIEFYVAFWPLIGKHLVDCVNYSFEFGELSNSQKQAIITLVEKKGKDKRLIKNWRPISLINVDTKIISKVLASRLEKVLPKLIHPNQNAFVKGRSIFDAVRSIDDIVDYSKRNGRGVRQGDPLSPYLFILALETLAIRIREDSNIQGLKIGDEEIKLSLFADDMTCILKDKISYLDLFCILESFGECSGLKMNDEKTEILALGNNFLQESDFPKHNFSEVIKILGIYFGYDVRQKDNLNFRETLKSIKKSVSLWKWRGLSLLGRIQIVKTFAIPKFMFRASVIPTSKELIKEVNSILYSFIWNGKDKVKRHALISDIEMGGLKMLDIDSMISAKRIICLKKFLEDYQSIWKTILDKLLSPVGGRFVLHCNFHISKLKISLPEYYKECFDAWSDLNGITPSCYQEIINEIIWNNRFLCYDKKSMYRRDIINLGFVKIGDLISEKNSFSYGINSLVNPEQRFFLMSIINSIPAEWRSVVKASTDHDVSVIDPFPNTPTIRMEGDNLVPILDASSKQIYQLFLQKKQIPPTAKQKLTDKYPNTAINWQKVYSLAFQTTLESKIREFQYKILNCIVFTNEKLSRIGLVESPSCTFCQEVAESVEHLLFSCKISSDFWKHVLSWLRDNHVLVGTIDESDLILGKFDIVNDFILINHILLLGKFYIYSRRCLNSVPTLRGFVARTRRVYNIELHIAREKNKLLAHFQKWEKLINALIT